MATKEIMLVGLDTGTRVVQGWCGRKLLYEQLNDDLTFPIRD